MDVVLQKWGNSMSIRIPKAVLDSLHWTGREGLSLNVEGDKLVIQQAEKRKTIQELFSGYEGDYSPSEIDWGEPVGKEL